MSDPNDREAPQRIVETVNSSYEWFFWALGLIPAGLASAFVTPIVAVYGETPLGVFLGTLALSVAVFLVTIIGFHVTYVPPPVALLIGVGALFVAASLASGLGQFSPDVAAFPPVNFSMSGLSHFIGTYLGICWAAYGPGGFILSAASGLFFGWRVAKTIPRSS
jgi:hypothetical protein